MTYHTLPQHGNLITSPYKCGSNDTCMFQKYLHVNTRLQSTEHAAQMDTRNVYRIFVKKSFWKWPLRISRQRDERIIIKQVSKKFCDSVNWIKSLRSPFEGFCNSIAEFWALYQRNSYVFLFIFHIVWDILHKFLSL